MTDVYVLYGAPGVGKGTISKKLPQSHILGTGSLLRKKNMGLDGKLVSDDIVNHMVEAELKKYKSYVVLDGYPRTSEQVDYLLGMKNLNIKRVYELTCPDSELCERLSKRQSCVCGATFHPVLKPTKKEGICDLCGQKLFRRKDDSPKIVLKRLSDYHQLTQPVLKKFGSLVRQVDVSVDFSGAVQQVVQEIKSEQKSPKRACRMMDTQRER